MWNVFLGFSRLDFITTNLNKQWNRDVITNVLMACVVLLNMIIENEGENLELAWQDHNPL
jgi:hypothetical protein